MLVGATTTTTIARSGNTPVLRLDEGASDVGGRLREVRIGHGAWYLADLIDASGTVVPNDLCRSLFDVDREE